MERGLDNTKASPFWKDELPEIDPDAKKLFVEYAKMPEEGLEKHLNEVRWNAFQTNPYPCIGWCMFLKLDLKKNKEFPEALERTKKGEKLLDFACALGQDLRSLLFEGAPASSLFGVDLEPNSIKAGYLLFNDKDCGITFRHADGMKDGALEDWNGQFSIITANLIWHVFTLEEQHKFGDVLMRLMTGKPNNLVFGRLLTSKVAPSMVKRRSGAAYLHTEASFIQLWEDIAACAQRKVKFEMQFAHEIDMREAGGENPTLAFYSVRLDE